MTTAGSFLHSRQVQGTRVLFYDRGSGPALVLIHGMFGDHLDWEPVLEPLSRRHRVIAMDLPGFGDSEKPDRDYTGEFFVAALQELLHALGVERATVVGNSFGGILAVLWTLAHPQTVERLVLISSGGLRAFGGEEKQLAVERMSEENLLGLTVPVQRLLLGPIFAKSGPIQERYFAKQDAKLGRADFPAYARVLVRSIHLVLSQYLLERLREIRCPTLLLWGDHDLIFPVELARHALEQLPDGRLKIVPGGAHALQLDCPEDVVAAIEEFLSRPAP
jgi:pimeloyl-ACP methyl ester carboxylesterase